MLVLATGAASADTPSPMVLEYTGRYLSQSGEPDHLLDVVAVDERRLVVAGNRGLALLDISQLTSGGARQYLHRLTGVNARNVYPAPGGYLYVNLFRQQPDDSAGLAVVRLDGDRLELVTTINEAGVLYEKMCLDDDLLYVAAHSKGLRVFDVSDPAEPVLVGRIDGGFTDAWAVAADGDVAWVADGAAGLKKVDVSEPEHPVLLEGEDLADAVGTSEDVTVRNGRVFVAAGGAGILVYDPDDLTLRAQTRVGGAAKDLSWVGDHLAAATISGIAILDVESGDKPVVVARELTSRRNNGTLRLCSAVGRFGDDGVLAADWNFLDGYRLVDANDSGQPDINCDRQRIRFAPDGGTVSATVWNSGGGSLTISGADVNSEAFTVDLQPIVLAPGESTEISVSYNGSTFDSSTVVSIRSDDPDEDPLPIQVFGNTPYLDPGDDAVDFELPVFHTDRDTGELVEQTFRLSDHLGKVVWFQIFGTW